METALVLSLYVAGILVWSYKKENLPIYCIYLTTFGLLAMEIVSPTYLMEDFYKSQQKITSVSYHLFLLCTFLNLLASKGNAIAKIRKTYKYWVCIFVAGIYFLFWQNVHGLEQGGGFTFLLLLVSITAIYYSTIPNKLDLSKYRIHFIIICIVELLFIVFNLLFGPIYVPQRIDVINGNPFLIAGSFYRYNTLASFLAMVGVIISCSYFNGKMNIKLYLPIIAIVCLFVLATGARMQLVWMTVVIVLMTFSHFKKHRILSVMILTGGLIFYVALKTIDLRGFTTMDAQSGFERQLYGIMNAFDNNSTEKGNQTQDISLYILENYFHRSPLIGNGLGYREYSYHHYIPTKVMIADAAIAYILVEYGVLGFVFTLLIIVTAFLIMRKGMLPNDAKNMNILFFSLFFLTITEAGIFDFVLMLYVWTYMAWVKYSVNNITIKKNQI